MANDSQSPDADDSPRPEQVDDESSDQRTPFQEPSDTEVSRTPHPSPSEPFERLEEIGSGAIGTVYRGRQTDLERDVAIKEIRNVFDIFADVQRTEIVERFAEVTREQARLSHPNVAQIIDLVANAEYPYVVSEYASLGNLRRVIEAEERPPVSVVLRYFLQILHGLHAAHERGLVHGNIKPENVLIDARGNAKLTDFGLSRLVDASDRGNDVYVGVGGVAYMSPEQYQNPNGASEKTDIYALGIMLYEMLTGKVPGRRSPMPSQCVPGVPEPLDDIFDLMSMDDPAARFDTTDEILAAVHESEELCALLLSRPGLLFTNDPLESGDNAVGEDADDVDIEEKEEKGEDVDAPELPEKPETPKADAVLDKLDRYAELFEG